MATQPQIHANRQNAQKSTGPRTQKGKEIVAQNALKHGLSARHDVVITENQEDFDLHRDSLLDELAPQGPMESMLADRIVSLSWRLKRADLIQNQTFDAMHEKNTTNPLANLTKSFGLKALATPQPSNPDLTLGRIALKDFANARVLDRLLMYERRIENSLQKTIIELQRLTLIRSLEPNKSPTNHPQQTKSPKPKTTYACLDGNIPHPPPTPFSRRRHDDAPTPNLTPRPEGSRHEREIPTRQERIQNPEARSEARIPIYRGSIQKQSPDPGTPGTPCITKNKPNPKNQKTTTTSYVTRSYTNTPPRSTQKNKPNQTQYSSAYEAVTPQPLAKPDTPAHKTTYEIRNTNPNKPTFSTTGLVYRL